MIPIMTVQEIFNTKAVQEIETEILNLQYETEKRRLFRDSEGFAIKSLLGIRRNILHDYFVMDENYKLLLSEFNEALKLQLIDMRNRTIKLYESVNDNIGDLVPPVSVFWYRQFTLSDFSYRLSGTAPDAVL